MDCEVLAIGTELLLGQIVDSNSAWIGGRLAEAGISCYYQSKVGDNHDRIVSSLRAALERSDAVICCGGLGPTQDDITREAIAEVMGVPLVRDADLEAGLRQRFSGRDVPTSNYKQADLPRGATAIIASLGTAPGLICPVAGELVGAGGGAERRGDGEDGFNGALSGGRRGGAHQKVVYAVPGVPAEMREMVAGSVVPDLVRRSLLSSHALGAADGMPASSRALSLGAEDAYATVRSRFLRVWGVPESRVAEIVAPRFEALEGSSTTIAFLANVTEGVRVRVTTRATGPDAAKADAAALAVLDREEAALRDLLGEAVGGIDDEGLEVVVARRLQTLGLRLALAESLTGGMVASRLTTVPGAGTWFAGALVSYGTDVKRSLLSVREGPVVSELAAREMAAGAARLLNADVGLSLTGVAGPDRQDDQPVGTVFVGLSLPSHIYDRALAAGHVPEAPSAPSLRSVSAEAGATTTVTQLAVTGERQLVRERSSTYALDLLRRALG